MPTLTLFGRPELADADGIVVVGRPAQRHCLALLALLAGELRGLSRDRVVGYLWPESDTATARHRLSVGLHVIRERLGTGVILAAGDALKLDATFWQVDVWQFEEDIASGEFEAARALYAGPLLDGFYLRGAPAYEQWLEAWRVRLGRRYLAVLESLASEAELAGALESWIEYRREVSAHEPCSSAGTLELMRSLVAAGRADGAIRCARAYALMVRDEYGMRPDPAVLASADAIARAGWAVSHPLAGTDAAPSSAQPGI